MGGVRVENKFKRNSINYSLQRQVIELIHKHSEKANISDSRWLDDLLCRYFERDPEASSHIGMTPDQIRGQVEELGGKQIQTSAKFSEAYVLGYQPSEV